jgi:Xaa-Pro aminopeptidase
MFQSFDDLGGPQHGLERVSALRAELARLGVNGFILPSADEFQSETPPAHAQRLLWLTGFSGSWGVAVVLAEKAALFVDGRYVLQARAQVDGAAFEILKCPDQKPSEWVAANAPRGGKLGFDPRLHTINDAKAYRKALEKLGCELAPIANPLDALWRDRPAAPVLSPWLHDERYAGRASREKIEDIRALLRKDGDDAALIASPQSVAWAFNLRGADVPHTPVALAHALVPIDAPPVVFLNHDRVDADVRAALSPVEFATLDAMPAALSAFARKTVRIDPDSASAWLASQVEQADAVIAEAPDSCSLARARKNAVEIAGARAAHIRDGAAVTRFLHWLDGQDGVDEIAAAQKLEAIRREDPHLRDISFDTISGVGPNGAIVHYRPSAGTNRRLERGSLFLIDSGGQYLDGTTDITRTVAIGEPSAEMRRHFTLVLKAHISLATARFPAGTKGVELDGMTRRVLWLAGIDYDHGTGHGVGSFLSVHEGPASIGKRGMAALEAGMIVSNEPGFYREGHYGIRIENLMVVTEAESIPGGDRPMHGFETLTLAPIDARLIDPALLTTEEIGWLNAYHRRVCETLTPLLPPGEAQWLTAATSAIA